MNNTLDQTQPKSNWLIVHFYMPKQHPMLPNIVVGYERQARTLRPAGTIVTASNGTRYVIDENQSLRRLTPKKQSKRARRNAMAL